MDSNVVFGACAAVFGAVTLVARVVAPESAIVGKLGPMRERFGPRAGTAVHVLAYTVLPLVLGSVVVAGSLASP